MQRVSDSIRALVGIGHICPGRLPAMSGTVKMDIVSISIDGTRQTQHCLNIASSRHTLSGLLLVLFETESQLTKLNSLMIGSVLTKNRLRRMVFSKRSKTDRTAKMFILKCDKCSLSRFRLSIGIHFGFEKPMIFRWSQSEKWVADLLYSIDASAKLAI